MKDKEHKCKICKTYGQPLEMVKIIKKGYYHKKCYKEYLDRKAKRVIKQAVKEGLIKY